MLQHSDDGGENKTFSFTMLSKSSVSRLDELARVIGSAHHTSLTHSERVRTTMHDLILPNCCCWLFLINYLLYWRRFIWCRAVSWWSCEFEQMNHGKWKNKPTPCIGHAICSQSVLIERYANQMNANGIRRRATTDNSNDGHVDHRNTTFWHEIIKRLALRMQSWFMNNNGHTGIRANDCYGSSDIEVTKYNTPLPI